MLDKLKSQLNGDRYIWWIVFFLSIVSLLAVYSSIANLAGRYSSFRTEPALFKHFGFILLGFALTFFIHKIDLADYLYFAKILLYISPVLLILTLKFGVSDGDARRAINVLGVAFQPVEFVKTILLVNLAALLAGKIHIDYKRKDLLEIIFWVGLISFLIAFSDFATAIIVGITCFIVMWIGKVPNKYLLQLVGTIVSVLTLALLVGFLLKTYTSYEFGRYTTVVERVESFVGKDLDHDGKIGKPNYQVMLAQAAIAKGGIIGVGPGNSSQKNILPEAYSDYIYSVILEEYGLLGGMLVMGLYLFLLARGILNIGNTNRAFYGLVCVGVTLLIVLQAFTHMAVNVGLGPSTGINLPLISRGGSSSLASFIALGLVLSVSRQSKAEEE